MRQAFENLRIKSNERVQDYVTRVIKLVNQMIALGDTISKLMVVGKVLRSMGTKYNHVVIAIEESRDITKLTLDDITSSLQAHESRLISQVNQVEEKVLLVKGQFSTMKEGDRAPSIGRGRGFYRACGPGRGRGKEEEPKQQDNEHRTYRSNVQCYQC